MIQAIAQQKAIGISLVSVGHVFVLGGVRREIFSKKYCYY
jgi:hypothetical protein